MPRGACSTNDGQRSKRKSTIAPSRTTASGRRTPSSLQRNGNAAAKFDPAESPATATKWASPPTREALSNTQRRTS